MTIVGTSVLPEPTMPTSPPEEAGAQGPKTPNPTMDGTAEGGPPRGGMQEIFAARHAAKGEVHDPPGQRTFAARKALIVVRHAIRDGVQDLLENGELTDEQADGVKEAASTLRHELRQARQTIVPGDISTAETAYAMIDEAVQGFFDTVEGILGGSEEAAPVTEGDPDTAVVVAEPVDADSEVADAAEADEPSDAFTLLRDSVTQALEGFYESLSEPVRHGEGNPFAGVYEAVGAVSDPSTDVVASTETTA